MVAPIPVPQAASPAGTGGPRVVLIPGLMGSQLQDTSRTPAESQQRCAEHWDSYPSLKRRLEKEGNVLCGPDSDTIWGHHQSLHWLLAHKQLLEMLKRGDGLATAGQIAPKALTDLTLKLSSSRTVEVRPYAEMIRRLRKAGADVLEFAYDWRLGAQAITRALNAEILKTWWPNGIPAQLPERERITVVGHSLGGLIGRLFIEMATFEGQLVVRRLITIGTPHRGAPDAFAYFKGVKGLLRSSLVWDMPRLIGDTYGKDVFPDPAAIAAQPSDPPRPITEAVVKEGEQQILAQTYGSVCQLMPSYEFVKKNGRPEPLAETYKDEKHRGTNRPLADVAGELSANLLDASTLDVLLANKNIYYDLVASVKMKTLVGLIRATTSSGFVQVEKPEGDGTVPAFSAIDWVRKQRGLSRFDFLEANPASEFASHNKLCQHPEVIEFVLQRINKQPKSNTTQTLVQGRMGQGNVEQYVKVARAIFLSGNKPIEKKLPANQTQVVCFALLQGRSTLMDTETVVDGNGLTKLKSPPPGIDSTGVVYSGNSGDLAYRFVLLVGNGRWPGGVLFLPDKDETWLHLFGIITTPFETDGCPTNDGHAEMQFINWLEAQKRRKDLRDWSARVTSLNLWNWNLNQPDPSKKPKKCGDRSDENWGFSPCAPCCENLAKAWWPDSGQVRAMHWWTPYKGREKCQNGTTDVSLKMMRDAGWEIDGCCPAKPGERPLYCRNLERYPDS